MILLISGGLFYFLGTSSADIVYLKNGKVLVGEIINQNDEYLEMKLKIGKAKVGLNGIESIERKEVPPGFFELEGVVSGKDDAGGKTIIVDGNKKPFVHTISLEARYAKENLQEMVDIEGNTDLPDGALVYIFLKRLDGFVSSKEVTVSGGKFSARLGPFDKPLPGGKYSAVADFFPYRQPPEVISIVRKAGASDTDIIHAARSLTIDKGNDPKLSEKRIKDDMMALITELQSLRNDLNTAYAANKKRFDSHGWSKWADAWLSRLRRVERKLSENSEEKFPLYPKAAEDLAIASQYLTALYEMNNMELREPEKFASIENNSEVIISPAAVSKCFQEMIVSATEEVTSN